MLDHEPDTNQPTEDTPPPEQAAARAPRRRRAASRPAGPPSSAADAPPPVAAPPVDVPPTITEGAPVTAVEASAPESTAVQRAEPTAPESAEPAAEPAPELPMTDAPPPPKRPRKAAAKRAPRKSAAVAAAEAAANDATVSDAPAEAPAEDPVAAETPAPRKRAPRKRAAKKVAGAAAESGADDLLAEASVAPEAGAPTETPAPAVEVPVATTLDVPEVPAPDTSTPEDPAARPALPAPTEEATAGAWAGEEAASEVPAALQELADAIARNGQPVDELEQALEQTPAPELAPLQESPLDVFEDVVGDTQVQADDGAPAGSTEDAVAADAVAEDPEGSEGEADDDDEDESREGDGSRRRRRRRGGRRRRRTGGEDDSAEGEDEAEEPVPATDEAAPADENGAEASGESDDEDGSESGEEGDGSRRRRRRRRRRGEDAGSAADDPGEVVVRVREPRKSSKSASSGSGSDSSGVTGIEGSTRMEAKRQRRRDGREAGRRRAPILSEAEFLARRESVSRKMIVRQADDLSQIAVIEDDILVEHYVDRDSATSLIGNVYLGRVQNVLPSMEAAFVDIGRGRNAVLYAGEVDWDSFGAEGQGRKVERVLKSGQTILVQVTKDPVGAKGARLTNHVSIPGRYIVYAPSGHLSGISRKLPDTERRRLKEILADLIGDASVIVRTAAEGASEEELVRDVNRLKAQWADIEKKVSTGPSPQLLYGEPDLTVRIVRDLFTEDFSELIIQGNGGPNDASIAVESYVTHVAPHLADRIRTWDPETQGDLFAEFRLDEQIAKGLERKVFLPSGGSLVIDRTEAMTVIDVNTGKFTGSGGNLEATVTSNNLEAAEEIVRQLRLRDIGGIIVIDFIDMVLPANRELLLRRLVECLGRDRTRHQVAEVTSLGLVQMTRKKIGTGLGEAFTTECPHCHGRGFETHQLPVDSQRQADGGTRDSGRGGGRRGGGNGGNGNGQGAGNSQGSGGGRSDNGGRGERSPRPTAPPVPTPEPAAEPAPVEEALETSSDPAPVEAAATPSVEAVTEPAPRPEPEERPRRRGGTRRRATREQGAPSTAEATAPADSPAEPATADSPAEPAPADSSPEPTPAEPTPAETSAEPAPAETSAEPTPAETPPEPTVAEPTVADPQAAPAADPEGEPVPSS